MSQVSTKFIANNAVTYAKFQQVAASSLIGNATGSTANVTGITIGATLTFSGSALQTVAITGDVTSSANSFVTTLATVNSNVGSFGSSTSIPSFTVNAKGLITAASGNAVVAPAGTLSGTTLNSTVVSSSLTSVGTITTGVWNGTTIAIANGGTGQVTAAAAYNALSPMTTTGDLEYESATNTASRLPIGTSGEVLTVVSGVPAWAPSTSSLTGLGIRAGKQAISNGATSQAVTFSSTLGSTSYAVTAVFLNTTDTNVDFQPVTITAQSATAFTATWNAPVPTANYVLSWQAILNN